MIKEVIEKYGINDSTINSLVDMLEKCLSKEECEELSKQIYESTQGHHFDECFAKKQISKMYYSDAEGKHYAPYWEDLTPVYNINKRRLSKDYNKWDFEVTMNMIKSDMYPVLKEWFPQDKDLMDKIIELSINWLNDEDYPDHKIWNYFR